MELIDREAVINATKEAFIKLGVTNHEVLIVEAIRNAIWNVPTIESRPQGKWINDLGQDKCSVCGKRFDEGGNYCGNCGAKNGEAERWSE